MLDSLLATNDHVTKDVAPTEDVRREFLSSRNEVVLRSLVHLLSSVASSPGTVHCSLTLSAVRHLVVRNRGLLAELFKQGLTEHSVNWIVELVPECMEDSPVLCEVLTEWSSLGAPERLVVADSALRLAIRRT